MLVAVICPGSAQEGKYCGELADGDREDRGVADPEPGRDPRQALVDRFEESQERLGHDDVQDDHDRERGYREAEDPRGGEDVPGRPGRVAGGDQMRRLWRLLMSACAYSWVIDAINAAFVNAEFRASMCGP